MRPCPNCGYPAVVTTCPYCKAFTVSAEVAAVDDPTHCPRCGSDRVDGNTLEGDDIVIDLYWCLRCHHSWQQKVSL